MSAPRRLNVALIGAGFMGRAHSIAYAAMPIYFWPPPAIPVRSLLCEIDEAAGHDARGRFGFHRVSRDWGDAIADPTIDIVDIAVPNDLHAEIAIAAAESGKHVFCEKPLARSSEEGSAMVDAVEAAGVVNMVAFNYRRVPAIQHAHQLLQLKGGHGRTSVGHYPAGEINI